MLRQSSVQQLRAALIPRENARIVVAMCYYPRGLKRELFDEFNNGLAPDRQLFSEWKRVEQSDGHDAAFAITQYESRFTLTAIAMLQLKNLSELSHSKDIFFACQCAVGERCHREMLMLIGERKYGAPTAPRFHEYPVLEKRISGMDDTFRWG